MKRISTIIIAMALVFGLAQCKKQETPTTPTDDGKWVHITLNVGEGDRHFVYPNSGAVAYVNGDKIYVGNNHKYVGTLTRANGAFEGDIYNPSSEDYLHFYFIGGSYDGTLTEGTTESFEWNISNQSSNLPVLSYGHSSKKYTDGNATYSCMLKNQCALVKFDLTNATSSAIEVGGLLTTATINFNIDPDENGNDAIVADYYDTGSITLYNPTSGASNERWAILLPGTTFDYAENVNVDGEITIANNGYITSGLSIETPSTPTQGIGSLIYDDVTGEPIAMVAYVDDDDDYVLAIMLQDMELPNPYYMFDPDNEDEFTTSADWNTAQTGCAYTDPDGRMYRLPLVDDWQKMIAGCGGSVDGANWNCDGLMTMLSEVGGTPMFSGGDYDDVYWTGTEAENDNAVAIVFTKLGETKEAFFNENVYRDDWLRVRPVIQIGGTAPMPQTTTVTWDWDFISSINISGESSINLGGITASMTGGSWNGGSIEYHNNTITFTPSSGNIKKIEMHCTGMLWYNAPSGWWWNENTSMLTWDLDPSPSVTMEGNSDIGSITLTPDKEIVFTVKNY